MVTVGQKLGRFAAIAVATMFAAHTSACEADEDQGGLSFQLPEGGGFELPTVDGSALDGPSADGVTESEAPRPDATDDAWSDADASDADALADASDASEDAAPPPDANLGDALVRDAPAVVDDDVVNP